MDVLLLIKPEFANMIFDFAIQVGSVKRFKKAKTLQDYNIKFAPQSYVYIEN